MCLSSGRPCTVPRVIKNGLNITQRLFPHQNSVVIMATKVLFPSYPNHDLTKNKVIVVLLNTDVILMIDMSAVLGKFHFLHDLDQSSVHKF